MTPRCKDDTNNKSRLLIRTLRKVIWLVKLLLKLWKLDVSSYYYWESGECCCSIWKPKEKSAKSVIINIRNIYLGTLANMANMSKQHWGNIAPILNVIGEILLSIAKQRRKYAEKCSFVFNIPIMLLNLDEFCWNVAKSKRQY